MNNQRQNILIISPQSPLNPNGGAVTLLHRFKKLSENFSLFLIVRDKNADQKLPSYYKKYWIIKKTKFNNIPVLFYRYFIKTLSIMYKNIFKYKIKNIQLEYYDNLIYSIFLAPIKMFLSIKIFYTAHDIECLYYSKDSFKFKIIKSIEYFYFKYLIDTIFIWGSDDKNELLSWGIDNTKLVIVPPIIKPFEEKWSFKNDNKNFVFIGSWKHHPNQDAVHYLLDIWPQVLNKDQDAMLYLVLGKGSENFLCDTKNVVTLGYVENIEDILLKSNVLLAPIISGTGIKIKIAEAFNFGIPVISTDLGVRNYTNINKEKILIANNKDSFVKTILDVLSNNISLSDISMYERQYANEYFSENNIDIYSEFYHQKNDQSK